MTVPVELAVTSRVAVHPTGRGYATATFTGEVSPAEIGARISVQRLVGAAWRLIVATYSHTGTGTASTYTATLRLRHGGYYRVFAAPVEDSHVASSGPGQTVHVSGRSR